MLILWPALCLVVGIALFLTILGETTNGRKRVWGELFVVMCFVTAAAFWTGWCAATEVKEFLTKSGYLKAGVEE